MWVPDFAFNRFHRFSFNKLAVDCIPHSAFPGLGTKRLRLQGKLTETLTNLYDVLVEQLQTMPNLTCSKLIPKLRKALAKSIHRIIGREILQLLSNQNLACVTLNEFPKSV